MNAPSNDNRLSQVRHSLLELCHEIGLRVGDNIEEIYHFNLIESGVVDSLGVVCLQGQIEEHYQLEISSEQFVAELYTLEKLARFLAANVPEPVSA